MQAQVRKVDNLRIQDALAKYEAAQRSGDPLDMCVKAKLVAGVYTDAKETISADAWRAREREACQLAATALGVEPRGR
jgi:hypothetical protein